MVNLPEGKYRLIDNRIVLGDSTWAAQQPTTICVLHHKQNTDEHRQLIQRMLDELNTARSRPALESPHLPTP
jgi:hypothetical protein